MTRRQREFCRHYAKGLTAAAAAVAAGYARSTAEHNAAAMLQHPSCSALIARLRAYRQAVTLEDLTDGAEEMRAILKSTAGADEKTRAYHALMRMAVLQERIEIEAPDILRQQAEEAERELACLETDFEARQEVLQQNPNQNLPQLLDSEQKEVDEEYLQKPAEIDELPGGLKAFDKSPARTERLVERKFKKWRKKQKRRRQYDKAGRPL